MNLTGSKRLDDRSLIDLLKDFAAGTDWVADEEESEDSGTEHDQQVLTSSANRRKTACPCSILGACHNIHFRYLEVS